LNLYRHSGLALLFLLALLPACSSIPKAAVDESDRVRLYEANSGQLTGFNNWSLAGRLAVSDSEDGGSGNFKWKINDGASQMDFHGALGRGAWRLVADSRGAELELADGTVHRAGSVDMLVRQQVGWEIPVDSLSWWVRGLVAPGEYSERIIDDEGNLSELLQSGWTIEYGKYSAVEGKRLPVKLTARKADWKVKLAIRDWVLIEVNSPSE
jgi:outer membrane lipoprotein LolB